MLQEYRYLHILIISGTPRGSLKGKSDELMKLEKFGDGMRGTNEGIFHIFYYLGILYVLRS